MAGKKFKAEDWDVRAGQMLYNIRMRFGMSQKDVAARVGVTFQQIQKYETAQNRMSISAMAKIAECFDMTPAEFLNGANEKYVLDPDIMRIINALYKTNTAGRNLAVQITDVIANSCPI